MCKEPDVSVVRKLSPMPRALLAAGFAPDRAARMPSRRGFRALVGLATWAAAVAVAGTGCDSSTRALGKDAGGQSDAASASGGAVGNGGVLGSGGATALGGAPGTGGTATAGSVTSGTGGRGGATGKGGATTAVGPGTGGLPGAGGAGTAGIAATGGAMLGGAGGTSGGGYGGATAKDANGAGDGPGLEANATVVYSGCSYLGGIERAAVARFDARTGVCVALVLESPHSAPDAGFGMTLSPYWGVAALALWPSATDDCATLSPSAGALGASSASGSVNLNRASGTIDIDAVFDFPSSDGGAAQSIEMKAQGVDFMRNC